MALKPTQITYDEPKLAELMLYVADQMKDEPSFGATVLNKILFFSDFLAYRGNGTPITGALYQKLPHGPAPRRLLPVQQGLINDRSASLESRDHLGFTQKRLVALRNADVTMFSTAEKDLVDQVVVTLRRATATRVSQLSHVISVGWQIAEMGEEIPYSSVFLSSQKPTKAEIKAAAEFAAKLGIAA